MLTIAAIKANGNLRKLWELRLSELAGGKITDAKAHVVSISFSPDGHRLAAVVWSRLQRNKLTLVILDVNSPRVNSQMLEYEGPGGETISWSPTGKEVAVPEVFQEIGQPPCILEHTVRAVFYGPDQVADGQPGFPQTDLRFYNVHCALVGLWKIDGMWPLSDGSAERQLLALANNVPKKTQILVVDPVRKRTVNRWPLKDTAWAWALFADTGKAICALDGTAAHGVAHCWDVDSGREIARTHSGNPQVSFAAALRAKRLVLSDYGWKIDFEGWQTEVGALHRRVVWDFGTGNEIASWKPSYQDDVVHPTVKEPYRAAISPDGTMVAEGGAGALKLSRIEP